MISISETATLLAFAKAIGYPVSADEGTVQAWTWMLNQEGIRIEDARDAIKDHTGEFLSVKDVIASVQRKHRRLPSQIEADVRVAKKLGLIPQTWDSHAPLSPMAEQALADWRAGIQEEVRAIEAAYANGEKIDGWEALATQYGVEVKRP
jgi:hypothetical protein